MGTAEELHRSGVAVTTDNNDMIYFVFREGMIYTLIAWRSKDRALQTAKRMAELAEQPVTVLGMPVVYLAEVTPGERL